MKTQSNIPKQGTLERILFDKLLEKGDEGVTYFDLEGTGITEHNIDDIIQNIKTGNYEQEPATVIN